MVEAFQTELMEDNRVALIYPDLYRVISEEMKWVIDLPQHIWDSLGAIAGRASVEIKDDTIRAAHTSYHFLWRRVLEPAGDFPWKLCRGNLVANLRKLKAGECPDEPLSSQLWLLLQKKITEERLEQVLKLLGHVGWTSLPCEQQHGSLAQLRRWHPEYTEHTLISRGLMHQTARLLPSISREEKRIAELNRRIAKICRAVPERAGGQHMLLRAMISIVKGRKDRS